MDNSRRGFVTGALSSAVAFSSSDARSTSGKALGDDLQLAGRTVKSFGAKGDGVTDDTKAILDGIAWACAECQMLIVPAGNYRIQGAQPLEIDLGRMSLVGCGRVSINCQGMTSGHVVQVFSSLGYPGSHIFNATNFMDGLAFIGNLHPGQIGLLCGHDIYAQNGQCSIKNCSFYKFDINHAFTNNSWRYGFFQCDFIGAKSTQMLWPKGLINSGESIAYYNCMFADGGDIRVENNDLSIHMYSCSILNVQILLIGNNAYLAMYGGNLENPNRKFFYQYARVSGADATLKLDGPTVIMNPSCQFTDSPFEVSEESSTILFARVTFPQGDHLCFEEGAGTRSFVKGKGRILASECSFLSSTRGSKPNLGLLGNSLTNPSGATGDLRGWEVVGATAGGTCLAVRDELVDGGSSNFVLTSGAKEWLSMRQQINSDTGVFFCVGASVAIVLKNSNRSPVLSLSFMDAQGNELAKWNEDIRQTKWTTCGLSLGHAAPPGTQRAAVELRVPPGGNIVLVKNLIANRL